MLEQSSTTYKDSTVRQLEKLRDNFSLSEKQILNILKYADFLMTENKKHNLTGFQEKSQILSGLFADSLCVTKFIDFTKLNSICDAGTGAGFPGLALKIMFPHLKVFLIELKVKKIEFLKNIIQKFDLEDVQIIDLDWRTFNRKTNFDIDLFVSKAAFGELEICRMFRENCNYKDKSFIYWASGSWRCDQSVENFVARQFPYRHSNKHLNFVEFKKK